MTLGDLHDYESDIYAVSCIYVATAVLLFWLHLSILNSSAVVYVFNRLLLGDTCSYMLTHYSLHHGWRRERTLEIQIHAVHLNTVEARIYTVNGMFFLKVSNVGHGCKVH